MECCGVEWSVVELNGVHTLACSPNGGILVTKIPLAFGCIFMAALRSQFSIHCTGGSRGWGRWVCQVLHTMIGVSRDWVK